MLTLPPPYLHVQLSQVSCWPFHRLLCTFKCRKFHADLSTAFFAHSIVISCMLTFPTPSLHVQMSQVSCWHYHRLPCTFNCRKFHADPSTAFFIHSIVRNFMLTFPPPSLYIQLSQVSWWPVALPSPFLNKTAKTALAAGVMLCKE